jgi:hypothetical protein
MRVHTFFLSAALLTALTLSGAAQEKTAAATSTKPVRMGCGLMTFETVPGWGLRPDGKSSIGPTHGSVVIDKAGNIYTSANEGVFVFSPDGKVIHNYLGPDYSNIHDMKIREEDGKEFIYQVQYRRWRNRSAPEISPRVGLKARSLQPYGNRRGTQWRYLPVGRICQ